jgi:hypothetical protein
VYVVYTWYTNLQTEHLQVLPDALFQSRRRDPLTEPIRRVVPADLRPPLIDGAQILVGQMRAPNAERLPE